MEEAIKLVFKIGCFLVAGYLTYFQFKLYTTNEDSSSVSYRTFNAEHQDTYPSYTVCIQSAYGDIFKKDNFLGVDGYSSSLIYNQILLGKCCKNKTLVEIGAALEFDEILVESKNIRSM